MSNKLSLLVNFIGVDKMSGALRNIVGLGRNGSTSLRALNAEARRLQGEMREVGREFKRSSGNVTQLIDRERALERALAGVNRQLDRQRKLSAIDADTRAIKGRGADLKSRGRDNVVGGGAQLFALGAALKSAVEYDSVMTDIGIKLGVGANETKKLSGQILIAATLSKQLPSVMQSTADKLATIGISAKDIPNMLESIGKVGTAYNALPDDIAGAAGASIQNLGVKSTETAKALALMAVAGKDGKYEIKDMASQFPMLAASYGALKQKGLSAVADLSAASQIAAQGVGGDQSVAGNNLNQLLLKINAKETISNFKKLGVDLPKALQKAYKDGKTPIEAISELTNKALNGDIGKISTIFGDQQAQGALLQLIPKLQEYRNLRASISSRTGEVETDFQRKSGTSSTNIVSLLGNLQTLAITVGSTVLPDLVEFSSYLVVAAQNVNKFAQAHPTLIRFLIMAAAGSATLRVGLGVLQFAFGGILGPIGSAIGLFRKLQVIGGFGAVFSRLATIVASGAGAMVRVFGMMRVAALFLARGVVQAGLLMLSNPIVLAITLIVVALAGAGYLIYANWARIKAAFAAGVTWIKSTLAAVPAWLSGIGNAMMQGLLLALNPVLLVNRLLSIARAGVAAFKNFFGIKSPSRLMMEMGGQVTGGLALGIEQGGGRARGSMDRVMGGIDQAARRPIGGGIGSRIANGPVLGSARGAYQGSGAPVQRAGSGVTVTINVYGAQGQDVKTLAREIKRELDQASGVAARRSYEGDR